MQPYYSPAVVICKANGPAASFLTLCLDFAVVHESHAFARESTGRLKTDLEVSLSRGLGTTATDFPFQDSRGSDALK